MSDVPHGPSPAGWFTVGGNPDDLVYTDGRHWTWRRWRLPGGDWHQEPILPPSATLPEPKVPRPSPAPPPWGSAGGHGMGPPGHPGLPPFPGGPGQPSGWGVPWPAWQPPPAPLGRLELRLSEPLHQSRWKTLLRGLLVLPNLIVLGFLEIAVFFVTIVMWFAAVFTAHVPEGMWRFSTGVLQWVARTNAYTSFLTDQYPPFELGDVPYPVSVTLERPDRFNRLAVLFRVILVIPAAIVTEVFGLGVGVFAVVTWVVTLVLGRCPRPLHLMLAAWLRYQLRYIAYYYLLTTEYPSAPLGDSQSTHGSLETGEIVLRGAAKAFAVVAIVLGVALYAFDFALPAVLGSQVRSQVAIDQLNALQSRNLTAEATYRTKVESCGATWRCVDRQTPIPEQSLQTQISTLESITFPTDPARHDADSLVSILQEERSALAQMQGAATQQTFETDLHRVVTLTRRLQPLVLKLQDDLKSSAS